MSQQINLLNPALIKQKAYLTLSNLAVFLVIMLIIMILINSYNASRLTALRAHRMQLAEELEVAQEQLKQASLQHTARLTDKTLAPLIVDLEQKLKVREEILEVIKHASTSSETSFSFTMRALARQRLDGLWLTGFDIDTSIDALTIKGRTLQPELVPQYLTKLRAEPALHGRSFSALNISMSKPVPSKENVGTLPDKLSSPPVAPEYMDFLLQSTSNKPEAVMTTKTDGKST